MKNKKCMLIYEKTIKNILISANKAAVKTRYIDNGIEVDEHYLWYDRHRHMQHLWRYDWKQSNLIYEKQMTPTPKHGTLLAFIIHVA